MKPKSLLLRLLPLQTKSIAQPIQEPQKNSQPPIAVIAQELSILEERLAALLEEKRNILRDLKRATTDSLFLEVRPFKATPATKHLATFKFGHSEEEALGLKEGVLYADLLKELKKEVETRIKMAQDIIVNLRAQLESGKENTVRLK